MSGAGSNFLPGSEKYLSVGLAVVGAALALAVWSYAPHYWSMGLVRDGFYWTIATFAVAAMLRVMLRDHALAALLGVAALYFAYGVGLNEAAAVALFLFSARALGAGVLWLCGAQREREWTFSRPFVIGLAAYVALFGALIHTGANSQGLYFTIMVAPLVVAFGAHSAREDFAQAISEASAGLQRLPFWSFVAAFAVAGFVARFAFFPTVGYDDNFYHLRLWTELTYKGRAAFDVDNNVWSVTPFVTDLLHAVVSLTAGRDARSALDLALMLLLLRQIWAVLTALKIGDTEKLLALALFASTPLLAWTLTTLQTELFLAWLAVLGARLLVNRPKPLEIGDFLALGAVAALCGATKLPAIALGGALFAVALAKALSSRGRAEWGSAFGRWPLILIAFAVFAFDALHAYVLAYHLSGNPILPLLNGKFCSGYWDCSNFTDMRWAHGFGLQSYLGLFFHTHRFMEARNYTAGFQYLFLLPLGLVLAWRRWRLWDAAAVVAPLLIYGVAMFSQISYLRYLFPVAGLATVAIAALPLRGSGAAARLGRFAVCAAIAVNLFFLPGIYYIFATPPQSVYSLAGRERVTRELSPQKAITLELNRLGSGLRVLYPSGEYAGAALLGQPLNVGPWAYRRSKAYGALKNDKDIAAFLHNERVDVVVTAPAAISIPADALVADYMARNGEPILTLDRYSALKVREQPVAYHRLFDLGAPTSANGTPRIVAHVNTSGATEGRYSVRYTCPSASGDLIAQVNWDNGPAFFTLTACGDRETTFTNAFTIPPGAHSGDIYLTTYAADSASITNLSLEAN